MMKIRQFMNHRPKLSAFLLGVIFTIPYILIITFTILNNTIWLKFPYLVGEPLEGVYYRVNVEDTISADGSSWNGIFRKGKENKLIVYFYGGGLTFNLETSYQMKPFYTANYTEQDYTAMRGLVTPGFFNPFKDYSVIAIPYTTGDIHIGNNVIHYSQDEIQKDIYHQGYNNYSKYINKVKGYVGNIDTLIIAGYSAGGFAASMLADEVMDLFPTATNVTLCIDSSLMLYDNWVSVMRDIWNADNKFIERVSSNNLVLDGLVYFHNHYPNVKILFDCSIRDEVLSQYQSYLDEGVFYIDKNRVDQFQLDLKEMVSLLKYYIPDIGIYIYETSFNAYSSTHHCLFTEYFFDNVGHGSGAKWILDAVNGHINTYGLELLDKVY